MPQTRPSRAKPAALGGHNDSSRRRDGRCGPPTAATLRPTPAHSPDLHSQQKTFPKTSLKRAADAISHLGSVNSQRKNKHLRGTNRLVGSCAKKAPVPFFAHVSVLGPVCAASDSRSFRRPFSGAKLNFFRVVEASERVEWLACRSPGELELRYPESRVKTTSLSAVDVRCVALFGGVLTCFSSCCGVGGCGGGWECVLWR